MGKERTQDLSHFLFYIMKRTSFEQQCKDIKNKFKNKILI